MSITVAEVISHAEKWFHAVASSASAEEQSRFHLYPDARLYSIAGTVLTLEQHHRMHERLCDERHRFNDFYVTAVCDAPERAWAEGTVYWEARYKQPDHSSSSVIRATVGEKWLLERVEDGTLRFVL